MTDQPNSSAVSGQIEYGSDGPVVVRGVYHYRGAPTIAEIEKNHA
jgi:hypothetical protein